MFNFNPSFIAILLYFTGYLEFSVFFWANFFTSLSKYDKEYTALTNQILKAFSVLIFRPLNFVCLAILIPSILAKRYVPSSQGVTPKPTSSWPKRTLSEEILISQLKDISHPTPKA